MEINQVSQFKTRKFIFYDLSYFRQLHGHRYAGIFCQTSRNNLGDRPLRFSADSIGNNFPTLPIFQKAKRFSSSTVRVRYFGVYCYKKEKNYQHNIFQKRSSLDETHGQK